MVQVLEVDYLQPCCMSVAVYEVCNDGHIQNLLDISADNCVHKHQVLSRACQCLVTVKTNCQKPMALLTFLTFFFGARLEVWP